MIKVCDAIMGSGKSSAAMTYMNQHPQQKFIYITPYLKEVDRVKQNCSSLSFVSPSKGIKEYSFKKILHTEKLVEDGKNIVTTHQAFKLYTEEMLNNIKEHEYTLIIDENIDALDYLDVNPVDIELLIKAGYLQYEDSEYTIKNDYQGRAFRELFTLLKARGFTEVSGLVGKDSSMFFWNLPPRFLNSFKDIFILTYLLDGQSIKNFLDIYKMEYTLIGVRKDEDGNFNFSDGGNSYIPEYVKDLKNKIHILDYDRMNKIGDKKTALSKGWASKNGDEVRQLKNHVYNYFNNIHGSIPCEQRMWSSYKCLESTIRGKGYTKSFLPFNARATNEYKHKTVLAYLPNIYTHVGEKIFYRSNGIEVDEDMYALSTMIQWIWRSAIRDGEEINIYIPSKRMRELLISWIDNVSAG